MLRVPAAVLLACLAVATAGCGSEPRAGATATSLAALDGQANRLLGGGTSAFAKQVKALRGHPIVVNQWASWCGPCRFEFPFFQRLAARYRGRVAFLGVDAQDNRGDAEAFLKQRPLPYPSYYDLSSSVYRVQHDLALGAVDRGRVPVHREVSGEERRVRGRQIEVV